MGERVKSFRSDLCFAVVVAGPTDRRMIVFRCLFSLEVFSSFLCLLDSLTRSLAHFRQQGEMKRHSLAAAAAGGQSRVEFAGPDRPTGRPTDRPTDRPFCPRSFTGETIENDVVAAQLDSTELSYMAEPAARRRQISDCEWPRGSPFQLDTLHSRSSISSQLL